MLEQFRLISKERRWRESADILLAKKPTDSAVEAFCTFWIEGGHHLRDQLGNDRTLVHLLRHMLPPYQGGAVEVFRGENKQRWQAGRIGLAWSPKVEVGRMFAGGLNAVNSGGVLLVATANPDAIISGPVGHSRYLGEDQFTLDPSLLLNISATEHFPVAH